MSPILAEVLVIGASAGSCVALGAWAMSLLAKSAIGVPIP